MPYTTPDEVQDLIARVPKIGSTSAPNTEQVTRTIANISAEVEVSLASNGFAVPVTIPAFFLTWVGLTVSYGVASIVLKSGFPESVVSENGGPVIPAYAFYEKKYQDNLKKLASGDLKVITAEDDSSLTAASSYFTRNPDVEETLGDIAEPAFKMSKVF